MSPDFEPCEVEARFTPQGQPRPQSMTWHAETYRILSVGRFWQSDSGYHQLVKIRIGTFELRFQNNDWQAKPIPSPSQFRHI